MRWYSSLLEDGRDLPLELRAAALRAYGSVANPAGEDALAERLYEESLDAYEATGDRWGIAELLMRLGSSAMYRDDCERARELGSRSLALARQDGYPSTESLALWVVGEAECRLGNEARGMELIEQSADLAGEIGFQWQRTRMLRRLADWALEHGNVSEADRLLQESLRLSHELGDRISAPAWPGSRRRRGESSGPACFGERSRPRRSKERSAPGTRSARSSRFRSWLTPASSSSAGGRKVERCRSTRRSSTRAP